MGYCSITDISDQISTQTLARLSNDLDATEINSDVVNNIIDDSTNKIDAYLRGYYDVPFTTIPDIIRQICRDLSICNLYQRRIEAENLPSGIIELRKEQINLLKQLQRGDIKAIDETATIDLPGRVRVNAPDRIFTKDLLDKF